MNPRVITLRRACVSAKYNAFPRNTSGEGTIKAFRTLEALQTVSVISLFSLLIRDQNLVSNCALPLSGITENVPLNAQGPDEFRVNK